MALASHFAIQAKDPNKSVFDLWKNIFNANLEDRTYNQQDYIKALSELTGSNVLTSSLERFSNLTSEDNTLAIASWFEQTELSAISSYDYPQSSMRHWGKKIIEELMRMHCKGVSFSFYEKHVKTYPIKACDAFEHGMEIQYINGLDIFTEGIDAYNLFRNKCESKGAVSLQNREKTDITEIKCLREVPKIEPYMTFQTRL